jgi:hypothetical protein
MVKLYNLARMSTATTGTGTITLGSAISGFLSFDNAGVQDGDVVSYAIQDGSNGEVGTGTYTASGTTLTRNVTKSTNSDAAISLSGGAQVIITPRAEEFPEGPVAGFRNHLINGGFMIAQRGTSFTSGSSPANSDDTYLLDRWLLLSDGDNVVDVSQDTADVPTNGLYACKLDVETASKKFGILQIIEQLNCIGLIGETVTLSFKAKVNSAGAGRLDNIKAAILAWSGTADTVTSDVVSAWGAEDTTPTFSANWTAENTPANLSVTTSWASYSVTAAIDTASTKNIAVFIWADGLSGTVTDTLHITDVQLEVGGVATPFERRLVQAEQNMCSRYFQLYNGDGSSGRLYASGYQTSGSTVYTSFLLPVPMRVTPTTTKSGTWTTSNCAQPTFAARKTEMVSAIVITSTGFGISLPNSSDDTVTLSAEL